MSQITTANVLNISFSALAPTVAKQLNKQKFKFDADEARHFEKCREGLILLSIHSILTDAQYQNGKKKLFRLIRSHVCRENKLSQK